MVLLLAAGLFLAGCGSLTSYAAKVNGQRITQNELDRELNAILGNKAYLEQVDQGFAQQTGERAIGTGRSSLISAGCLCSSPLSSATASLTIWTYRS